VTLHGSDLIAIAALLGAGFTVCYALLLWKLRAIITERQLRVADQIGALDEAIRVLETRFTDHQQTPIIESSRAVASMEPPHAVAADANPAKESEESAEIAPDIQVAIAAAAAVALGPNAVVQSATAVASPWTQQGRVLVQGGHNFRVRR
jgi:hypothetical protein